MSQIRARNRQYPKTEFDEGRAWLPFGTLFLGLRSQLGAHVAHFRSSSALAAECAHLAVVRSLDEAMHEAVTELSKSTIQRKLRAMGAAASEKKALKALQKAVCRRFSNSRRNEAELVINAVRGSERLLVLSLSTRRPKADRRYTLDLGRSK